MLPMLRVSLDMHAYGQKRLPQLRKLCRIHKVKQLDLFGSGTGDRFNIERSDLDFVVEVLPTAPRGLRGYFGFKFALEALFARDVNLVEAGTMRNP
jgi:predicted nucleotidyltransferase